MSVSGNPGRLTLSHGEREPLAAAASAVVDKSRCGEKSKIGFVGDFRPTAGEAAEDEGPIKSFSSSKSGVSERPSESLKLFSRTIIQMKIEWLIGE